MTPTAVGDRTTHITKVCDDGTSGAPAIEAALVSVREVRAWLDGREAVLVRSLGEVVPFPEAAIAGASKSSLNAASKTKERADTLASTPTLAAALDDGAITAGHIDAITRSSKQLDESQRTDLFDRVDGLANVAAAATIDEFDSRIKLETKHIQADDGIDRLNRQRRNTRLRSWVDGEGMWNLAGRFDPVTGVKLAARLDHVRDALFAEQTPDGCPSDPIEKQRFLSAHALTRLALTSGAQPDAAADANADAEADAHAEAEASGGRNTARSGSTTSRRPEFIAVIDADAPNQVGPVADWAIPVEVPAQVLAELADDADVHAVVVRNGVILHAPGKLDWGRQKRLATHAQRRALVGLYRCCAIPGCTVGYDRCRLHHIIWWSHGGRTDLDNLLPVCTRHHTKIHNDGWLITLGARRELTLTLPGGKTMTTGPPRRNAA